MFKWIIVAIYTVNVTGKMDITVYGPYSYRDAKILTERRDFNLPEKRLISVDIRDLADARKLPLKLVKLP